MPAKGFNGREKCPKERPVRMQRSSSHVGVTAQNYQYHWSIMLDKSIITQCGSTSTTTLHSNYYCTVIDMSTATNKFYVTCSYHKIELIVQHKNNSKEPCPHRWKECASNQVDTHIQRRKWCSQKLCMFLFHIPLLCRPHLKPSHITTKQNKTSCQKQSTTPKLSSKKEKKTC